MTHFTAFSLTLVVLLGLCDGAPMTILPEDQRRAEAYLSQFYRTEPHSRSMSLPENELKAMQTFFGLEVTGNLDSNTLETMKKPRCGVPDVVKYTYFEGKPRWTKSLITYQITEYTEKLDRTEVDVTIAKAFQLYSDVIPLDFQQIYSGTADITILFKAKDHGDFFPFDGPDGQLAHAYAPGQHQGGDAHFDDDETWTLSSLGINLLLVAAHEFGHSLGLHHSTDRSALMYPHYQYVNTDGYTLPYDDRVGVQALYGVREPKPRPTRPEPCDPDLVFDAATSFNGRLYFFKDGYYWRKEWYGVLSQHKIKSTWPSIDSVDAAYAIRNKAVIYLFKGRQYWAVNSYTTLPGYPKDISTFGFPAYVKKIDAAVHVTFTGLTLFFVGNEYWRFFEPTGMMYPGFPRLIRSDFPGIGSQVDAALENYGYLYFTVGTMQIEYYFPSSQATRILTNNWWLDCYSQITTYEWS